MANTHDFGDRVRCSGTVTSSGTEVDPDEVRCDVKPPSGTVTTYEYGVDAALERSDTGDYYIDVDGDEAGRWNYRFYCAGNYVGAGVGFFYVNPRFGP